jgi:hypothetical protein
MQTQDRSPTVYDLLRNVVFVVEANGFERLCLWNVARGNSEWSTPQCYRITVGHIDTRPVCVALTFVDIDGQPVLFIEAQSRMVDYDMVDAWLQQHVPAASWTGGLRAVCDAANFHRCQNRVATLRARQLQAA